MALAIADRLLHRGTASAFRPSEAAGGHPDLFQLRPAGKMRQISADTTRELIGKVQVTSAVAGHKVAIIHEDGPYGVGVAKPEAINPMDTSQMRGM